MPSKILQQVPVKTTTSTKTVLSKDRKSEISSEKKKQQLTIGSFFKKNNTDRKTPKSTKEIVLIDESDEDNVEVIDVTLPLNKTEGGRKGETQCTMFTDSESSLNLNVIEDQSQTDGSSQGDTKKECRNLLVSMEAEYSNISFSEGRTVEKQDHQSDEEATVSMDVDEDDKCEDHTQEKISTIYDEGDHPDISSNNDSLVDQKTDRLSAGSHEIHEMELKSDTIQTESHQYCLNLQRECEDKSKELVELGIAEAMDQDLEDIEECLEDMPCCTGEVESFPDKLLPYLACIVQGSCLPLSSLSTRAQKLLCIAAPKLKRSLIATKIQVIANRKAYLKPNSTKATKLDDDSTDSMWRWELISYDLLPQNNNLTQQVKKRKAYRGKIRISYNALQRINKTLIKFYKTTTEDTELKASVFAQVKEEEQKLLKLEQEKQKSSLLFQEKEQIHIEKENLLKECQFLKEAKQKKRDLEKLQAKKVKEEEKERAKNLKEGEKERAKKLKDEQLAQERKMKAGKLLKNKHRMLSFFSKPTKTPASTSTGPSSFDSEALKPKMEPSTASSAFDSEAFRSKINSCTYTPQALFPKISPNASKSRRMRTKSVEVTIEATSTVSPTQLEPCIELRVISVPNKYKFLKFFENCRPAYCGTWCKSSNIISGRQPFKKDTKYLDYEYDSEAEWEEEEPGEDLEEEQVEDDEDDMEQLEAEEGGTVHDTRTYNFGDGWMVDDDDALNYSDDEDALSRKENKRNKDLTSNSLILVPPLFEGFPSLSTNSAEAIVEGNGKNAVQEAKRMFEKLKCEILLRETEKEPPQICLDPFPPCKVVITNKTNNGNKTGDPAALSSNKTITTPQPKKTSLTTDELKLFARFIHNNELNSRDKLLEELLLKFQDCKLEVPTRALLYRTLIANVEKKKVSTGSGVVIFWQVKKEQLLDLGLNDLLNTLPSNLITANKRDDEKAKKKADLLKKVEAKRIDVEEKAAAKKKLDDEKAVIASKEKIISIDQKSTLRNTPNNESAENPFLSAEKKRKSVVVSKASTNLLGAYFKKGKIERK